MKDQTTTGAEIPQPEVSLEDQKTIAETDKAIAEAAKARFELESLEFDREWRLARPENSGRDLELMFAEHVDTDTVHTAIFTLNVWSRRWPGAPITIVLNSPGGEVIAGLALYDYLRSLSVRGHHIITRSIGWAASMGGVLLQAGDTREVGPNSFMLIHEVSSGFRGKASAVEDDLKFTQRLQDKIIAILADRSTMTEAEIRESWSRRDWWLDAEEAVTHGFADKISAISNNPE